MPTDPLQLDIEQLNNGELPVEWRWVNSSPTANVAYNQRLEIYYKEFLNRNAWDGIKALIRGSRCQRAISMANALENLGFNTPHIISSGKTNKKTEYMLSQGIVSGGVASYLASYLRNTSTRFQLKWKRLIISELGREIGRLHQKKIIHGDLRPNNILIELGKKSPVFYFIDNERSKRWPLSPPKKLIYKNLVQIGMLFPIDISKTDRLRFWQAYCLEFPRYANNRVFMKAVYERTTSRLVNTPHYKPRVPDLPEEHIAQGLIFPSEE